ncbi:hypothetical protein [Nonomuraea basaltis]|uniref:hypothetical protein n=1 Tax=Nonomuraea basaltis TaxID=2495887 RepID=UPI00110C620E|nr:hypothetical protein [Nonomuraea basaltis]TMR90615.1 hypothetical protein EJK15_54505 [Nonomuraea basaltis]
MNLLDVILSALGLPVTLAIPFIAIAASYRRARPYRIVGHHLGTGMIAVRFRDERHRTHLCRPDHLPVLIADHLASLEEGRAAR